VSLEVLAQPSCCTVASQEQNTSDRRSKSHGRAMEHDVSKQTFSGQCAWSAARMMQLLALLLTPAS
jgi:hypothetical protein